MIYTSDNFIDHLPENSRDIFADLDPSILIITNVNPSEIFYENGESLLRFFKEDCVFVDELPEELNMLNNKVLFTGNKDDVLSYIGTFSSDTETDGILKGVEESLPDDLFSDMVICVVDTSNDSIVVYKDRNTFK